MAKRPTDDRVSVKLKCVYSGHPNNPGPGDIIEIDAIEAARLIGLGAAEKMSEK